MDWERRTPRGATRRPTAGTRFRRLPGSPSSTGALARSRKRCCSGRPVSRPAAGLEADEVEGIVVSTCTGYLCPGLSGYVVERLGLPRDVRAFDLVGHGCAAALPNWQLADALLESRQCRNVVSVCVELSSAAMYL